MGLATQTLEAFSLNILLMELRNFNNIAIIQTAFLGDTALALYLAQSIKNSAINSTLHFVTSKPVLSLVSSVNCIDSTIVYDKKNEDKGWWGIVRISKLLRSFNNLLIICPHQSLRSALICKLSNPEYSVGFNKSQFPHFFNKSINYNINQHEVERNFSLIGFFDDCLKDVTPKVDFKFDLESDAKINSIIEKFNLVRNEFIIIAPGSVWGTKKWSYNNFIQLIEIIQKQYKILLIGGKGDIDTTSLIASKSEAIDMAGKLELQESLLLMKHSKLIITNDSAPTHFASLLNKPVITIFGPTVPDFGFYPIHENARILSSELSCKPCSIHGANKCPIRTHDCMNSITPRQLANELYKLIDSI